MKKNVLIIGAGGIGSFFCREFSDTILNEVKGTADLTVTVYDADEVETKNIRYQNFEDEDVGMNKSQSISDRYFFISRPKFIETEDELKGYDIIIVAVDNTKVRRLVYDYCLKNDTYFIDMRSEGKTVICLTKHEKNTKEELEKTLDDSIESASCQLDWELKEGKVQMGNRIIAMIGLQYLLNYLRGENNPPIYSHRF